ncbi:MAG: efflux RND transporter periplasmic adaptor subunit [Spirochaetales bacterium]|nr:efflux RND transporter periplasmic adaptor subunit [Spirochaetales bacterium]
MKIKKRLIFIIGAAVVLAVCAIILISMAVNDNAAKDAWQFTEVTRGPIQVTISSTGTISPQKSVDVGTQVSGIISKLYADFNDHVTKGQLLATLDTTMLALTVQSANADMLKATAQYELDLKDYDNNILLHGKKLISDYDLETSRVKKNSSYASRLSAEANLAKAKANLDYAVIRSPIDGIVIDRVVEEGQTVAASSSVPKLYTIAENMNNIQIKAYVAESDIGSIKKGQKVTFTVTTYASDVFQGIVDSIHLQSETISNVVNYVVMINAVNTDNKLLPGMTATVNFIIDERENALLIANAALQFRPPAEMIKEAFGDNTGRRRSESSGGASSSNGDGEPAGQNRSFQPPRDRAMLWALDEDGKIKPYRVTLGITDGQKTEIVSDAVNEGMKFLSGQGSGGNNSSNGQNSRRGPRMFF